MLAFTFPGQGSQRQGMGTAWTAHPSWELVAEASEEAGRDVGRLLLEADDTELRATRNAQLTTYVLSLVVLDAVERVGLAPAMCAGHSLGEYTALTATGTLSFADGVRVVTARGEAMQEAADDNPGTMAAVLGLDDDDADAACRRADGDVWVANFNAPGPGGHRRRRRGGAGGRGRGQGPRRQEGHGPPGRRGLPHPVHGAGPGRPAQGGGRGDPAGARRPRRGQHRRPAPHRPAGVGPAAVGPAPEPGALAPERAAPGRRRGVDARRARPGRRAHRHGQAHRPRRAASVGLLTGRPRPAARGAGRGTRGAGLDQQRGRAPVHPRAPGREPGGRVCSAGPGGGRSCPTTPPSRSATCSAQSAGSRSAPPSPARSWGSSPSTASG